MPRHKSSLAKQFHTELVSPVKQSPYVKLDYTSDNQVEAKGGQ